MIVLRGANHFIRLFNQKKKITASNVNLLKSPAQEFREPQGKPPTVILLN